jgi:hypothetical protein
MSEDQKRVVAKEYVDKQLETMKRYGSAPDDFSDEEYEGLVEEVVEAIDLK